jgi:hypothetical protein
MRSITPTLEAKIFFSVTFALCLYIFFFATGAMAMKTVFLSFGHTSFGLLGNCIANITAVPCEESLFLYFTWLHSTFFG